jgi:D-amino peptidase
MKVHISADMEGIAGVVGPEQLRQGGFEYQQFREFMTAEVTAAIEGARESGATEIVVSDAHGTGLNLLMDKLPQNIQLVRSWPRPLGMMEGIDDSFAAAVFIGYHAGASNVSGIVAHTVSSKAFLSIRINDQEMSEGGINALIAGYFGVPVVMISGDDAAVREVSAMVGPIEEAVVKWCYSHSSCRTLMPDVARSLIREKVMAGLDRRRELNPFQLKSPLTLDLTFKNADAAEIIAYLPGVALIENRTVRFVGSIIEISMFIEMACAYPATMA